MMARRGDRWTVSSALSLDSLSQAGELVAFNVGGDGAVYGVFALAPLDLSSAGAGSLAKTPPSMAQRYRVCAFLDGALIFDLTIDGEPRLHDIQPIGDDILLVWSRSRYRGADDFDLNGRILHRDGTLAGEIFLGDGIETIQTTTSDEIWASYFDEGIFGGCGWPSAVWGSGLVAWGRNGDVLYHFSPQKGLGPIIDCYALNVVGNEHVWFCYYNEFSLVHLWERQVASVWKSPAT